MRVPRLLALTVVAFTFLVVMVPASHAETIDIANGTLVIGVSTASRGGSEGAELTTSSTEAPVEHTVFTGCAPGIYHTRCTIDDAGDSSEPQPSASARYRGTEPYVCGHLHASGEPKHLVGVDVCVPGRVYPVPFDRCILVRAEVTNVVVTISERCLFL